MNTLIDKTPAFLSFSRKWQNPVRQQLKPVCLSRRGTVVVVFQALIFKSLSFLDFMDLFA